MNTIYTYYNYIPYINNDSTGETQKELIELCKLSWKINGWKLIVLNYEDAKKHSFYDEYHNIIKTFPSVNPTMYDYHCYMRWLAMAQVGGGVMIDYDVVNHSLSSTTDIFNQNKLTIYQGHVPCVVWGTEDHYIDICKKFTELDINECLDSNQPEQHTSDMLMLSKSTFDQTINKLLYVEDYPNIAPLIHCSQKFCSTNQTTKWMAMKEILNSIEQK